jgi:hypothetical protein
MNNLTTLPADKFKTGAEGLYAITDTLYHDHKLAPDISRGLVVEMITKSPAHVKAIIDGKSEKKVTPAMEMGTLTDKALLEPDRFKIGISHWVRPEGLVFTTKEGKAWRDDHLEEKNLPIIYAEQAADIQGMIESVMRHKLGRIIVENSVKQESAFCIDPDTGLLRKCRPDTRMMDNDGQLTLTDLKTTFLGGASPGAWSSHCAKMGYHYQDSFYTDIYTDLIGERPYFLFMPVERKPPYACRVFQIHHEGVSVARERYKRALEQFQKCRASGVWPSYPEEIETIRLPNWEIKAADPIVVE